MRGALPDHQKLPLTIGYWTGMRRGEILKLQWTHMDLERGLLRLEPGMTKNGEGGPPVGDGSPVCPRTVASVHAAALAFVSLGLSL